MESREGRTGGENENNRSQDKRVSKGGGCGRGFNGIEIWAVY